MLADAVSHSRCRVTHTVAGWRRPGWSPATPACPTAAASRRCSPSRAVRPWPRPRPTHVAGVRRVLVDLVDEEDFDALGRVFDAVTDRLIEANPAMDIR